MKERFLVKLIVAVLVLAGAAYMGLTIVSRPYRSHAPRGCRQNLVECQVALLIYMEQYNSTLPSSAVVNGSTNWNKADFETFAKADGVVTPQGKPKTWAQLLWPYAMHKDIFCCSDDAGVSNPPVAYWWRIAVDKAWYGVGCNKPCRVEGDLRYALAQIILYERNARHCRSGDGLQNQDNTFVVYMDARAKSITLENATSGDSINCVANSDGEPMYFNYDEVKQQPLKDTTVPAKYVDPQIYSDRFDQGPR